MNQTILKIPKNIFDYTKSILNGHVKYKMDDKIYSQYLINHFLAQHKDTIEFVLLFNKNGVKLSNQEHYDAFFNYCPKVKFIKINKMPKKLKLDHKIFQITKRSSNDINRILGM